MENKELLKEVQSLVQEVEKTHRYSMSRIYGAYNTVFGKDEKPQACASCLIRKMKELKKWLTQNETQTIQTAQSPAKPRKKASTKNLPQDEK